MRRRRGFSLIEAAIVLGIIGLVIGGIWVAAAAVQEKLRFARAQEGMLVTIDGLRQAYRGQDIANGTDLSSFAITGQVVPPNWIKSPTALVDPWGGPVTVGMDHSAGAFCSAAAGTWHFSFNDVSSSVCYNLLARVPVEVRYATVCDTDGCSCGSPQGTLYACTIPGMDRHTVVLFFPR